MKSSRTPTQSKHPDKIKKLSKAQKAGKIQDAPGGLKDSCQAENRPFEKSIEPLEILSIQHSLILPDFIDPTRSRYPLIVRTPSAFQCIDGWDLIENAQRKGDSALTCEIFHIHRDSEIEIAILKASARTMPPGGICIYPEEVGNTCRLFMMICESAENPVIFSHGGARRGDSFPDRHENNIRLVLAERLGKSLTTINKYLQHGKYLSEETLQALINAGVKKGFFEAIQKDKQRLIDDLKSEQKPHDEIIKAVSDRVLSWLEEGQTSDPPEIVITHPDQEETPAGENQSEQDTVRPSAVKPIEHKHWSGNPTAAFEKEPTEDDICQEFIAIGRSLIETAENQKMSTHERLQILSAQIINQSRLIQQLNHLLTQQSINPEGKR